VVAPQAAPATLVFPEAQAVQLVDPAVSASVLDRQVVQLPAPAAEYLPAAQSVQVEFETEYLPAAQSVQAAAPAAEDLPAEQLVQEAAAAPEKVPAEQSSQEL